MKFFQMLLSIMLLSSLAMAGDGITGSLQTEGYGGLLFLKIVLIIVVLVVFFGSPIGGYFMSTKLAKKALKNEQEEDAGWKITAAGVVGGIIGVYIGYFVVGWLGSMIMDNNDEGKIMLAKGTHYMMSTIFGDLGNVATGGATN